VTVPASGSLSHPAVGGALREVDTVARAMWKGAIQFGLVTIPIKLYLATESKGISFNMLHKDDLSRIQMKVWCPVEDEPISRTDTVKGFEYAPGEYVVVTDEDLEKVPLKTVRSIEIEQFTKAERDDAAVRFVKSAYYVEPDKIGRKAFYLLKSVLEDEGLTAICKVVIKDREALSALDPFGETMLLTTLHWPDEIRATDELDLPEEDFDFKPAELAMAKQLVSAMTGEFDPAQYKDEYREALEGIIRAKVEGQEIVEVEAPEEGGKLIDLMAALEASVKSAKEARAAGSSEPVSVADAREAKEARAAKAAGSKAKAEKPAARSRAKPKADEAEEEEARAKPARKRKSA
jgi:DNA end-binding protein Ku